MKKLIKKLNTAYTQKMVDVLTRFWKYFLPIIFYLHINRKIVSNGVTLINNLGWGNMFKTEIHGNLLQTLRLFQIHSGCNSKPTKRRLCYLTLIKMHGFPCSHIWSDVSFLDLQFPRNHHPCIWDGLQALLFFKSQCKRMRITKFYFMLPIT